MDDNNDDDNDDTLKQTKKKIGWAGSKKKIDCTNPSHLQLW